MKKGFTLAEVLITLSIISVIAILTLPSLVKEYKYKIYGATIEKTYSQLYDAVQAVMNDEMTTQFYQTTAGVSSSTDCTKGPCYFFTNYLKATRYNCQDSTPSCVASAYHSSNSDLPDAVTYFGDTCAQLNSGATICMSNAATPTVFIDINGPAEPNIAGLDAFVLHITNEGEITDIITDESACNKKSSPGSSISSYASGCLTKVMNNGWKVTD